MIAAPNVPTSALEGRLFDNQISCEWMGIEKATAFLDMTTNALRIMQ